MTTNIYGVNLIWQRDEGKGGGVGVEARAKMISMQFAPHKSRNVSQEEGKPGKEDEVWLAKIAGKAENLDAGKGLPERVDR